MKRVYCLYRVSTKGQVDNDDIPMQRIACREFAKEQGWRVLKEFSEKGVSGFKVSSQKRDAIQQIKLDAEKSLFDVLLVFMFDRLGRRDDETPFIVEWFVKNGIEVWSVKEGEQRFDSHVDKLMNYIRYWQASGESIKTSERVKTRLAQITQEGHFRGGTVPYGYKLVKKGRYNKKNCELYDIEKEDCSAKIVEFIFDKYIYAGMGVQRIANLLNENKVATKTGKPWHPSTILNIIKNRSYIGVIKNGNVTSAIILELQIISEEKYQLAQDAVKERAGKFSSEDIAPVYKSQYALFSGKIYCATCGSKLVSTSSCKKYTKKDGEATIYRRRYYSCSGKIKKIYPCDGQRNYYINKIDDLIVNEVKATLQKIAAIAKVNCNMPNLYTRKEEYENNITSAKLKYERISNDLEIVHTEILKAIKNESSFSTENLNKVYAEKQKVLTTVEAQITEYTNTLEDLECQNELFRNSAKRLYKWAKQFQALDEDRQKYIMDQAVKKIIVSRSYNITIEYIDEVYAIIPESGY